MATLWDKLTKKKAPEVIVENTIYNLLSARINDAVKINTVDLEIDRFVVKTIREVKRRVNGQDFILADYDVASDKMLRIRLNPADNPDSKLTHDVILFAKLGDDMPYDKAFHEGLAYEENKGEFTEGDATYWRVNDQKKPWNAKTVVLRDLDNSGKVDTNEAVEGELTYWDFWRNTKDEADNEVTEFYIVEMDGDGVFTFWVGTQIDPLRIVI